MDAAQLVSKYKSMGFKPAVISKTIEVNPITKKPIKWGYLVSLEKAGRRETMMVATQAEQEKAMKKLFSRF